MKPTDVRGDSFAEYNEESNEKDPRFKIANHVRISKYKKIFLKGYTRKWSKEVFGIKKVKNTVPWTYVINDLNGEEVVGSFYVKNCKKIDQKEFRIKKVVKRKENILYMKGYDD